MERVISPEQLQEREREREREREQTARQKGYEEATGGEGERREADRTCQLYMPTKSEEVEHRHVRMSCMPPYVIP